MAGQAEIIVAKQRNGPIGDVSYLAARLHALREFRAHKPYDDLEQFNS